MKLPPEISHVHASAPGEAQQKRIVRVGRYLASQQAEAEIKRVSICLRLSMQVASLTAQKARPATAGAPA
eukprot:2048771-Pyramimonas_sp.AAC.1